MSKKPVAINKNGIPVIKFPDLALRRHRVSGRTRNSPGPATRRKVLEKCDGKCWYCDCELSFGTLTLDHLIPHCNGGSNHIQNLVAACKTCNHNRGLKDPHKYRQKLRRKLKLEAAQ